MTSSRFAMNHYQFGNTQPQELLAATTRMLGIKTKGQLGIAILYKEALQGYGQRFMQQKHQYI